jgi:hypothetical protein
MCLPNSKLYTQISKKLSYKTQKGFMKVESSTWQHVSNHLKYCSYHISYPNLVTRRICLPNSKFSTQISNSCVTKFEKVCEISLKFQAPKTIPTHFHYFKSTTIIQLILPLSTIYQD